MTTKPKNPADVPVTVSMRKDRILGVGLAACGLLAMTLGGSAIGGGISAMGRQDPLVAYQAWDATAFFAGFGVLAIGLACLLPVSPAFRAQRGAGTAPRPALALPLMVFAAVCIVTSPLSGSIGRLMLDASATSHGYVRCPVPHDPRHQPDRWSRPGPAGTTACPR